MTERIQDVIERLEKRNHLSTTFWRDMYADLLSHCRIQELHAAQPEGREQEAKALKLLQQAADGLYNGFEPDNQSALWLRINAFLKSEAQPQEARRELEWNAAIEAAAEACIHRAALCGGRALPVNVGEVCAVSIRALLRHGPQEERQ